MNHSFPPRGFEIADAGFGTGSLMLVVLLCLALAASWRVTGSRKQVFLWTVVGTLFAVYTLGRFPRSDYEVSRTKLWPLLLCGTIASVAFVATVRNIVRRESLRTGGAIGASVVVVTAAICTLFLIAINTPMTCGPAPRRILCKNNLKQIGLAMHNYHDVHRTFPMGSTSEVLPGAWGMMSQILPYLELTNTYNLIDFEAPGCCQAVKVLQQAIPPKPDPSSNGITAFFCPDDFNSGSQLLSGPTGPSPATYDCGLLFPGDYLGVSGHVEGNPGCSGITNGSGTFYSLSRTRMRDITDGSSNTMIVGERGIPSDRGWGWYLCGGTECEHYISSERGLSPGANVPSWNGTLRRFWSWHAGGAHFLLGDGSVRFLSYNMDFDTYRHMSTRSGGEIVSF
ncbi:MAG: DUF1559 domain-containing protein [Planctomycetaceae bacterium]